MIGVAVVGYGYWGPNLVRNFWDVPGAKLVSVCDLRSERLAGVRSRYPAVETTSNLDDVMNDPRVNVVAVATPVSSHFEIAKRALLAGKHVFIEKPMTATVAEGLQLLDLAERRGLIVGVDHTFVYTSAIRKMRELVESGDLGDIYYYDSARSVPARRQRDLGPGRSRSVDHGLRPETAADRGVGDRPGAHSRPA
jgi:predicted dehydrogenase